MAALWWTLALHALELSLEILNILLSHLSVLAQEFLYLCPLYPLSLLVILLDNSDAKLRLLFVTYRFALHLECCHQQLLYVKVLEDPSIVHIQFI